MFYLQKSVCVLNLFDANVEHAIRVSFIWPRTHFQASITAVNKQNVASLSYTITTKSQVKFKFRWCIVVRALHSRWADRGFDSRPLHCRAMCLCSPSSIIWYLARAFMLTRRMWSHGMGSMNKRSIVVSVLQRSWSLRTAILIIYFTCTLLLTRDNCTDFRSMRQKNKLNEYIKLHHIIMQSRAICWFLTVYTAHDKENI